MLFFARKNELDKKMARIDVMTYEGIKAVAKNTLARDKKHDALTQIIERHV